jgi:hypothetical protein
MESLAIGVQIVTWGLFGISLRMGFSCMINLDIFHEMRRTRINSLCTEMITKGRLSYC